MSNRNGLLSLFLAKIEATEGTDSVPTAAANYIPLVEPLLITPEYVTRTPRRRVVTGGTTGAPPLKPSGRIGKATAKWHGRGPKNALFPSATNFIEADPLFRAGGFAAVYDATASTENVRYRLASTGIDSASVYHYEDGLVRKMVAVRTGVSFGFEAGGPVTYEFPFVGFYGGPLGEALPSSQTYGQADPPIAESVALTIDGYATGVIRSFSCAVGQAPLAPRGNANATRGIAAATIRSADPRWTIVLEEPLVATKDFEAIQNANIGVALSWTLGAGYSKQRFQSTALARIENVTPSEDGDTRLITLEGGCYESVPGGNDAFSLYFGNVV